MTGETWQPNALWWDRGLVMHKVAAGQPENGKVEIVFDDGYRRWVGEREVARD